MSQLDLIKSSIKSIPDYPKAGIIFRDITSLLEVPEAFKASIDAIVEEFKDKGITKIVGTESRGFIFGAPVALALGVPFVLVRKPKKFHVKSFHNLINWNMAKIHLKSTLIL